MRALVLTLSFGSGHLRAAQAIADELNHQAPNSHVVLIDAFTAPDESVRAELISWGAPANRISNCGIPIDSAFDTSHDPKAVRLRYGINNNAPVVLLMGGGMGPTRMHQVAEQLCESNAPMQIVAIAGKDRRAQRRLERATAKPPVSLRVVGWTDEVAALMQLATLLVTKPGGLTISEAALSSLPVVFFDPIPGAEFVNAKRMVDARAALIAHV